MCQVENNKNQKQTNTGKTTNKTRAVAGQRSSPESRFGNKTEMFFIAKNKRRTITGP